MSCVADADDTGKTAMTVTSDGHFQDTAQGCQRLELEHIQTFHIRVVYCGTRMAGAAVGRCGTFVGDLEELGEPALNIRADTGTAPTSTDRRSAFLALYINRIQDGHGHNCHRKEVRVSTTEDGGWSA